MHLYYHLDETGKRVYTLKKKDPEGKVRSFRFDRTYA